MRLPGCVHTPPCRTNTWVCAKKTDFGRAVTQGLVTVSQANHLLQLYGEYPLQGQPVMTGKALPDHLQQELL